MIIRHESLKAVVKKIFAAAGCVSPEDERIASHLVEANLVGHDSHGVIRVPFYLEWLRDGKVLANRRLQVIFENDAFAMTDGQFGFGQSIGEEAMELAIAKSNKHGIAVVALRNCGHLGRIGDWAIQATNAGKISLHFVNTSGLGLLVAPHGGIERRLSANPIAVGIPVEGREPIILDISTCAIAEGKLKVARNKGVPVPDNCIIDPEGRPTNDPKVFYGPPPGSILPFGGHKGYGLGIVAEILAGALTGNGCSEPNVTRLSNGMLTILLDPKILPEDLGFDPGVRRYLDFVKTSRTLTPDGEILLPGEIEERTRRQRVDKGIELDETTRAQIVAAGQSVGVEGRELVGS